MFSFQFHWYGLLIGLGLVVGTSMAEFLWKKEKFPEHLFWPLASWVLIGGVVGARLWHVATDFYLYANNVIGIFEVWRGGLSILGGVAGGLIGLHLFVLQYSELKGQKYKILDLAVFGLVLGQVIGRLGNFANQELYGLPTNLSWGLYIDGAHRLAGYEQFSFFHPLFAYEAIAMLLFFFLAWKLKKYFEKMGAGSLFLLYVFYYSWLRFLLDFLRIDKVISIFFGFGTNQCVLLICGVVSTFLLMRRMRHFGA